MLPSPAEVARTLVAGLLLAVAYVPGAAGPLHVRHATDAAGRVLLLARAGGRLSRALEAPEPTADTPVVVVVDDIPPVAGAPSYGRVWICGRARVLTGIAARSAAVEFACVNPASDLLDVGRGFVLYRVEVSEVQLEREARTVDVALAEYAAARPDPVHPREWDLLLDLADHHQHELCGFLRDQLARVGLTDAVLQEAPRVVRLDRYGLVVSAHPRNSLPRVLRLAFHHPVEDVNGFIALIRPVLAPCPHHRPSIVEPPTGGSPGGNRSPVT